MPSAKTTEKATRMLAEGRVRFVGASLLFDVDGELDRYRVTLAGDECACTCANRRGQCWHVEAARQMREAQEAISRSLDEASGRQVPGLGALVEAVRLVQDAYIETGPESDRLEASIQEAVRLTGLDYGLNNENPIDSDPAKPSPAATPNTIQTYFDWRCTRCHYEMVGNHRLCPACGYTVFARITDAERASGEAAFDAL